MLSIIRKTLRVFFEPQRHKGHKGKNGMVTRNIEPQNTRDNENIGYRGRRGIEPQRRRGHREWEVFYGEPL